MKVISPLPVSQNVTHSRASTGTSWNINGTLTTHPINEVRYNWARGTGVFEGVLWEPSRTNRFINSTTLSTQSVSTTPETTYTVSFYGTGSLTITGLTSVNGNTLSTRVLSGTGNVRASLTFLALSSTTTFTVSGSATYAQLEIGSYPTSWISTTTVPVTRAADVFSGDGLFNSTFVDTTPAYNAATSYGLGDVVQANNRIYESLQAANLNKNPLDPANVYSGTDPDEMAASGMWWLDLKPNNTFALFDRKQIEASVGANGVQNFAVKVPEGTNVVALLNVQADTVSVALNNGQGSIASQTKAVSGGVVVFQGLDTGSQPNGAVLTVYATRASGVVVIGEIVFGNSHNLGDTQYGLSTSVIDYSGKSTDVYGNTIFKQRAFAKRMRASVLIKHGGNPDTLNNITGLLYYLRSTPTVWIATDDEKYNQMGVVYGTYKDLTTAVPYPTAALCDLEIDGLI
jgi:hypothetical protein